VQTWNPLEIHGRIRHQDLLFLQRPISKTLLNFLEIVYASYPNHSLKPIEDHSNCAESNLDVQVGVQKYLPAAKGPRLRITVHINSDHAHDLVTRRSVTGILAMLKSTSFGWIFERQKTVEASTFSFELVTSKIATERFFEIRYVLCLSGIVLDGPALMLDENMSLPVGTLIHSSTLKKHNVIVYHGVREAIATRVMRCAYMMTELNVNDI
jgi:hypothetical protein